MSGHTPGPWAWLGEPGRSVLNAAEGEILCHAHYEGMWPASYGNPQRDAANMRLIAQSPELLSALQAIKDLSSGYDEDGALGPRCPFSWETVARMAMDIAARAIAKAEGK